MHLVQEALTATGQGWWPPDLILAVHEGRDTYWTLGGPERGMECAVTDWKRQMVQTLLDKDDEALRVLARRSLAESPR